MSTAVSRKTTRLSFEPAGCFLIGVVDHCYTVVGANGPAVCARTLQHLSKHSEARAATAWHHKLLTRQTARMPTGIQGPLAQSGRAADS